MTQVFLVALTVFLAGLASVHFAHSLAHQWGIGVAQSQRQDHIIRADNKYMAFSAAALFSAAILGGFVGMTAFDFGGTPAAILADFAIIPLVGFIWAFIIGSNKVLERLITGLDSNLRKDS